MEETLVQKVFRYAEAISNKLANVNVIFVKYDPSDKENTDFSLLIKRCENALFIYNENLTEYENNSKCPGGGNAVIRPFRSDTRLVGLTKHPECAGYALGIPTGDYDKSGRVMAIDLEKTLYAILKIGSRVADHGDITDVYVASDTERATLENFAFGVNIFRSIYQTDPGRLELMAALFAKMFGVVRP